MRHAARRDTNEAAIVQALEAMGAQVVRVSSRGAPDVLVFWRGQQWSGEIKTGKGTLTPAQVEAGAGRLWPIWRTPDDALRTIGAMT